MAAMFNKVIGQLSIWCRDSKWAGFVLPPSSLGEERLEPRLQGFFAC